LAWLSEVVLSINTAQSAQSAHSFLGSPPALSRTTSGPFLNRTGLMMTSTGGVLIKIEKPCPFCGVVDENNGKRKSRTVEHIIPQWLAAHLGMENVPITGARWDVPTRKTIETRRQSAATFVAGRICADCNTVWMSQLENEAKPVLVRLIDDPKKLAALSADEKKILARWTLKTAAAVNLASFGNPNDPRDRPIPTEHLRALKRGGLPNDVVIVAAGHPSRTTSDFVQNASWASPNNSVPIRSSDRERSYKIGMSFRNLLLGVAYFPDAEYCYGMTKEHFLVLWNGTRTVYFDTHGMGEVPIVSVSAVVESFLGSIFLVSKTWLNLVQNTQDITLISPPYGRR
jgi:hypothetical protein